MKNRFMEHVTTSKFFKPGSSVLLAISGGVDSMVLLDLFEKTHRAFKVEFKIAHFNHKQRQASDEEEKYFQERGAIIGIYEGDKSDEASLRQARYDFFESLEGIDYIVTAHHADDNAETYLLKLIRNNDGMPTGIKEIRGNIVRPLLPFSKKEIINYANQNNLKWFEDETNAQNDYTRNKVRNLIIPEIEKLNPSFSTNINETIKENEILERYLDAKLSPLYERARLAQGVFDTEYIQSLSLEEQHLLLKKMPFEFKVDALEKALAKLPVPTTLDLPAGYVVEIKKDAIKFVYFNG
ncbi:MAG: tRNA lysidine(34) synthetase TilS [Lactobacillales bacterium]|jgi:tRNA(Ile)-lysidine synthase|nr:tRNA lysidine(34) synthetase TilS [Lactobacillales bacterium]